MNNAAQNAVRAHVEIYTTPICPYCVRAKALLKLKGASYAEHNVGMDRAAWELMVERAHGRRSVPQIFINDRHIGGFDDMDALNRRGELDPLLAQSPEEADA
ncbi:MAG: glutaredoxin 3 [Gammaproteobacteria bacterium]|nr:glutaredoxin 3 [Gammaproteobacteria bacterium]